MSERRYTVADAILDILEHYQVTHIFGYPGGAILPFYDALPYHKNINHVLTRHEQGAAFMAQGWARSTGKLGVCCATSGPGATNVITGIMDAMLDSIPTLFVTGQVPLNMIGNDMFQEADMTGLTMSITKHNYLLDDPLKTVQVVTEAICIATSGRPGPVHIDVPKNIMDSDHPRDFEIPTVCYPKPQLESSMDIFMTNEYTFDQVIDLLQDAQKPVLLIGQGIKHAKAQKELESLVNALAIPTVSTLLAKGLLSEDNPNYLGWLGMHGYYHCNMAMHEADLIINIGSRFDDRIVGRYDRFGENAKIIHIDIDSSEFNKVVDVDMPIQCDAKHFIEGLLKKSLSTLSIDPWREQILMWKKQSPYERDDTDRFVIRSCIDDINTYIQKNPHEYICSVDVGQHQMWASSGIDISDPHRWLCSGGSGTMGFSLPAAIGASFAHRDKTILCMSGDGGVQMNIQELGVIADHNLNVKILVLNNSFLGMVRQWQELFYDHNYSQVDISSPDYCTLAKAYGIESYLVTNKSELKEVHEKIMNISGPVLVEYRVEKEDNVLPMVPAGKHLGETISKF